MGVVQHATYTLELVSGYFFGMCNTLQYECASIKSCALQ